MATEKYVSTNTVNHHPVFRPHGHLAFRLEGNIMVSTAVGPFNKEIIEAVAKAQQDLLQDMVEQQKWAYLVYFEKSVLAPIEALEALTNYLRWLASIHRLPTAVAFVIAPELEGAQIMIPHFQRTHAQAGMNFQVFATPEAAQAWLNERLAQG